MLTAYLGNLTAIKQSTRRYGFYVVLLLLSLQAQTEAGGSQWQMIP
jgi:hypothetical protein